jgi:hypothetical protein
MQGFQCDICSSFHKTNEMCKIVISVPLEPKPGFVNQDKDSNIYECCKPCAAKVYAYIGTLQEEARTCATEV